eukprot:TRINITY_DN18834_c0_g2_i1.p1 TRINITY_DN18834_c0_g2~~TRINITY_DN18834_c0_g2_i1.p1  ORF type:complete len:128 (+),score=38.81 TRINITY_DN18834_c0_g2_i1:40-423(+)
MAMLKTALTLSARSVNSVQARTFVNNDAVKKWAFNLSGFNQYGLYHDDVRFENDEVKEAIRRLPQNLQDERAFRIQRALQCSVMKTVLPKDQWPTYEEDRQKGRYLTPYLNEVLAEKAEREEWAKNA